MIIWGARVGNRLKNYTTTRFTAYTREIFAIRYTLLNLDVYSYFLIKESFHHAMDKNLPQYVSIFIVFDILQSNVALPFFNTFYRQYCCLPSIRS